MILLIVSCAFLLPVIFYLLTLMRTLEKCAPPSRTMEPALVWLYLIPLVNLVFAFFIVFALAKSLRNEFNRRGIYVAEAEPAQGLGIAMCVCACCTIIPFLGVLALLAHLVLWVMYWIKIADYSKQLDLQPTYAAPPAY